MKFPSLTEGISVDTVDPTKGRICIITQDIVGPMKNGGIGTAYTYAARALANAGHDVTILYSLGNISAEGSIESWIQDYEGMGIKLVPISEPEVKTGQGLNARAGATAYNVYEWLKRHQAAFDLVHVSEWQANAYYCLLAKNLGLEFQRLEFVVKTSSPTLWSRIGNNEPIETIPTLYKIFMERMSVEWADYVVSGSQYMLNWMLDNGYRLPKSRCFVQPNIFPTEGITPNNEVRTIVPRELVFFGRLEPRKGLEIYCDAIGRLIQNFDVEGIDLTQIKFTFLGKPRKGVPVDETISAVFSDSEFGFTLLPDKSQPEALDYLRTSDGAVAIMPSTMDNSPFGVYECLAYGLPFITSTAGGGKELIATEYHETNLFEANPQSIYECLLRILKTNVPIPIASFDFNSNLSQWMDWHTHILQSRKKSTGCQDKKTSNDQPLVSICLAHHNRPALLAQAIRSIDNLIYDNFEVIVVDDGSTDKSALRYLSELEQAPSNFPIKIIRQSNLYLGAVRNTGARNAKGEYLLFMDDDNCAKPNQINVFLEVAQASDADILTCFADAFEGDEYPIGNAKPKERILFFGADLSSGLFRNPYGDSNCFVKSDAFKQLGGFTEHYKVGRDDQEFFSRAVLEGKKLYVVPEALYWYRISKVRMRHNQYSKYAGFQRVLEPYLKNVPVEVANAIRYSQGIASSNTGFSPRRADNLVMRYEHRIRKMMFRYPQIYRLMAKAYNRFF